MATDHRATEHGATEHGAIEHDVGAAPPDDGGELGNFTRPTDLVMVRTDPSERRPPLSVDPTSTNRIDRDEAPRRGLGKVAGTVLIAAISAALVAIVFLLAGG